MQLVKVSSDMTALLFFINAAAIVGNDVFFGVKSSLPLASVVVGLLFLAAGVIIWSIGSSTSKLATWITPDGLATYKRLSRSLTGIFTVCGLIMLFVSYALASRIIQGFSIFG